MPYHYTWTPPLKLVVATVNIELLITSMALKLQYLILKLKLKQECCHEIPSWGRRYVQSQTSSR